MIDLEYRATESEKIPLWLTPGKKREKLGLKWYVFGNHCLHDFALKNYFAFLFSLSGLEIKTFRKLKGSQSFELILERAGDNPCDRVFVVGDRVIVSTEKNYGPVANGAGLEDIEDIATDQRFTSLSLLLPIIDVASCCGSITKVTPNAVHIDLEQKPRRLIEYVKAKNEKGATSEWTIRLDRDESFSTMNTLRYVFSFTY